MKMWLDRSKDSDWLDKGNTSFTKFKDYRIMEKGPLGIVIKENRVGEKQKIFWLELCSQMPDVIPWNDCAGFLEC